MNENKTALLAGIGVTSLALILLLIYSFERTSWLFGLFEQWRLAAQAAALVVEVAAVALLVSAGALAHLDARARAWSNRALVAVLSISGLANLAAGFLRGGRSTLALFDTVSTPTGAWSAYAVAAALWLVTNLSVPALILCLSKLLEQMLSAYVSLAGSAAHEDDSYIGAQPGYAPARVMDQPTYPAPVLSVRPSARVEMPRGASDAPMTDAGRTDGQRTATKTAHEKEDVLVLAETTRAYSCEACGAILTLGQYGASKRHGHCHQCKSHTGMGERSSRTLGSK